MARNSEEIKAAAKSTPKPDTDAKSNKDEEIKQLVCINDAIEEFLDSDFEIKASNAAKKIEQNSKRFAMFNPSKLLSPLFSQQAQGQEEPYDPYTVKSELSVFNNESGTDFKAALLLHNFTSIVCLHDINEPDKS